MKVMVEPPMRLDGVLPANIQFADWVAAYVTRAIGRQLIEDSRYRWISSGQLNETVYGSFTHESKLHSHSRSVPDLPHSEICTLPSLVCLYRNVVRRIKAAAGRHHGGGNREW